MKRDMRSLLPVGVLATLAWAAPAQAQQAPVAPQTDISRQGGSLSDKLDATGGVIHPESPVDPSMQKTPPATGAMPVIPPPGSPGGNQEIKPK